MKDETKKRIITVVTIMLGVLVIALPFQGYFESYVLKKAIITDAKVEAVIEQASRQDSIQTYKDCTYSYVVDGKKYEDHDRISKRLSSGTTIQIYYRKENVEDSQILGVLGYEPVALIVGILFVVVPLFFAIFGNKQDRSGRQLLNK